jgi:Zn-dependent protease
VGGWWIRWTRSIRRWIANNNNTACFMNRYYRLRNLRVFGAPVYVHWTVLAVSAVLLAYSIKVPFTALAALCSYFGIILLHETGHAYFARRAGARVEAIYLALFHGMCVHEAPARQRDIYVIAWGGALAQLAVALPLILLANVTPAVRWPIIGEVVLYLGYVSLLVAVINLIPAPGLDGASAWRLLRWPTWPRKQNATPKRAKHLRRVK